jgi:hypothetical protein
MPLAQARKLALLRCWLVALATNLALAVIAAVVLRSQFATPHEGTIDIVIVLVASTAHFWFLRSLPLLHKLGISLVSAGLNVIAIFVVAIWLFGQAP